MARPLAGPPSVCDGPALASAGTQGGNCARGEIFAGAVVPMRPDLLSGAGHPPTPDAGDRGDPRPAYIPRQRRGAAGTPPQSAEYYQ